MKRFLYSLLLALASTFHACTPRPEAVQPATTPFEMYPDYRDVTIPCNIAPLNFLLRTEGVDVIDVRVRGNQDSLCLRSRGHKAIFPLGAWKSLLAAESGHTLIVSVQARVRGKWQAWPDFAWHVVADSVDARTATDGTSLLSLSAWISIPK